MHASRQELEAVYRRMRPGADLLDKPRDTNSFLAKQVAEQLDADRVGVYKVPDDVWAKFHGALVAALKLKPTPNINLHGIEGFDLVQSVCADVEPKALDQFIRCHIGLYLTEQMHGTGKANALVGLSKVAASARTIQLEVMPMAKRMVRNAETIRPDHHHDDLVQLIDGDYLPNAADAAVPVKGEEDQPFDDQTRLLWSTKRAVVDELESEWRSVGQDLQNAAKIILPGGVSLSAYAKNPDGRGWSLPKLREAGRSLGKLNKPVHRSLDGAMSAMVRA